MGNRNFSHDDPILVIGLGRFGSAVATELSANGQEVLAIEKDRSLVQRFSGTLTHVVEADASDLAALEQIGAQEFGVAVVGVGTSIESSVLIAVNLVELGIGQVWAKAITPAHGTILERIGCHRVIYPEQDAGVRTAHMLSGDMLDFMEISAGYAIAQIRAPQSILGKPLQDLNLRAKHGVTVVSIKTPADDEYRPVSMETMVQAQDLLIVAGRTKKLEAFSEFQ